MRIGRLILAVSVGAGLLAGSCTVARSAIRVRIVGVYPIAAPEPCHLVEASISGVDPGELLDSITQEVEGQPRENWQAPYDERELEPEGTSERRVAFFFHYLDLRRPLLSAAGDLVLPAPAPLPARLESIRYEPPD